MAIWIGFLVVCLVLTRNETTVNRARVLGSRWIIVGEPTANGEIRVTEQLAGTELPPSLRIESLPDLPAGEWLICLQPGISGGYQVTHGRLPNPPMSATGELIPAFVEPGIDRPTSTNLAMVSEWLAERAAR
jgi:hypothetical protein